MNYKKSFAKFIAALSIFFAAFVISAKTLAIFSITDFHGKLDHNDTYNSMYPGIVILLNKIDQLKAKYGNENTIIVAGGDNYAGSVISFTTKGAPVNDMFKYIGISASAVGNHEFDWGQEHFKKWQTSGSFSYVACNIIDKNTKNIVSWAKPYVIVEREGVKVAFIGLTTADISGIVNRKHIRNLEFKDTATSAQYWIDFLNKGEDQQGKPDIIILLTHIPSWQETPNGQITGEEINNICEKVKGIDAILAGHSHQLVCGKINGIPLLQAGCFGEFLGVLKIDIDDKTNKVIDITPEEVKLEYNPNISSKPATDILAKYAGVLKQYETVIGNAPENLSKSPKSLNSLGVFIAKTIAMQTDSQIGLTNAFGIRCKIHKGPITLEEIFNMIPFDNQVFSFDIKGNDLRSIIEHGILTGPKSPLYGFGQFWGLKVKFDSSKPYGERIVSMELLDGSKIEADKYYKMATSDFLYHGGDGFDFTEGTQNLNISKVYFRDMIIDEIKKQNGLFPENLDGLEDIKPDTSK